MRNKIAQHEGEWDHLLAEESFREAYPNGVKALDSLKSVPRGFDPGHPVPAI